MPKQHLPILKICSCPCQAGPNGQHGKDNIAFRNLQNQLKYLEHDDNAKDNDQQPRCGQRAEHALIHQLHIDRIRYLQQVNDLGSHAQPYVADLRTCQQEEGKHKSTGEKQFWIFTLKTKTGRHAFQRLKHQIADQKRPAHSHKHLHDVVDHRNMGFQIGEIHAHNIEQR